MKKNQEKAKFIQQQNGFPGIIGCIDCTQIAIQAPPTEDDQFPGLLFYNHKGFYSINTQIVCGGDLKILAINPRCPGDHSSWLVGILAIHWSHG
ncbi:hypothetical protein NQ314_009702 [Rhamnusium bicolor]|uniref:DDE Tnp4 domain-containing protein n=1 Tax=Rhamnusium bicolor TaxID=1586634 RepID=A0AAV8XYM4_9CUCU|nr:hypothetical protein NQ314_009702 [Rhamnusium bicolor]